MSKKIVRKFEDSVAAECRWSEFAAELIGDWDVVWEDSYADYQGNAEILACDGKRFRWIEWNYGSCSGCDGFEDQPEERVREEFKNELTMEFEDVTILIKYLESLMENASAYVKEKGNTVMRSLLIYAHMIKEPKDTRGS